MIAIEINQKRRIIMGKRCVHSGDRIIFCDGQGS